MIRLQCKDATFAYQEKRKLEKRKPITGSHGRDPAMQFLAILILMIFAPILMILYPRLKTKPVS